MGVQSSFYVYSIPTQKACLPWLRLVLQMKTCKTAKDVCEIDRKILMNCSDYSFSHKIIYLS